MFQLYNKLFETNNLQLLMIGNHFFCLFFKLKPSILLQAELTGKLLFLVWSQYNFPMRKYKNK